MTEATPKVPSERRKKRQVKAINQVSDLPRYSVHSRTGGRFDTLKPVFSKDERYVFLSTKREVKVYSTTTGELVRPLHHSNTKGSIVAVILHPDNEYRLITITSKGQVHVWDWTDASLIRAPVEISGEVVAAILVGTTLIWSDGKQISIGRDFPELSKVQVINKMSACRGLCSNGEQVLAYGDKSIFVFRLKKDAFSAEHDHRTLATSCSSIAISAKTFAYADSTGAIYLQQLSVQDSEKMIVKLHWHSSTVHSLEFALNGQYLLSAGEEGVLVLWQLNTANRQYLPRISGVIDTISRSTSSKLYAVKTQDNAVKIINATDLELQAEIVGPRSATGVVTSATRDDDLLLTVDDEIQAWNLSLGRTAFRTPIVGKTFAGQVRDDFRSVEAAVTACAVTDEWMASLDTWSSPREEAVELGYTQPQDEVHLKFWKWNGQNYDLIARIDEPHDHFRATQILAGPNQSFFTVGDDASVKLWRQKTIKKDLMQGGTHITGATWTCSRIFKLTRPSGICKIALSPDSSILALHTLEQTFLIDPVTGTLKETLSGFSSGKIIGLGFVGHHLVILGFKRLIVWDLLIGAVSYALRLPSETTELQLTCGQRTFALTTNEQSKQVKNNAKIFIFDPSSAKPIYREKCSRTLTMVWSSKHGFVQVTDDLEVVKLSDAATKNTKATIAVVTDSDRPAGITSLYRPLRSTAPVAEDVDMQDSVVSTQRLADIFDDPLKTLESRFEDLALLVLGAPQPAFDHSA